MSQGPGAAEGPHLKGEKDQ